MVPFSQSPINPDLRGRVNAQQYVSLFSDRFIISTGTTAADTRTSGAGPLKKGLKVVVILSGREKIQLEGHPELEINGPQSCVILNTQESNKFHWIAADIPLRFVLVQIAPSLIQDELGIDLVDVLQQAGDAHRPLLHVHSGNNTLESLASQIVTCPMHGAMRQMYLAGKGFELVASAINPILKNSESSDVQLLPSDIKRVQAAYNRLIQDLDNPPSLAELGREVGLSSSKLTLGFRRAFGTTVFGILQEHRLHQAHRLLVSGQLTVSEAAYRVGYSPAHFATIFRHRFGISPSKLRKT